MQLFFHKTNFYIICQIITMHPEFVLVCFKSSPVVRRSSMFCYQYKAGGHYNGLIIAVTVFSFIYNILVIALAGLV